MFIDHFSFTVKFSVLCLSIEQFVPNSRPILCLGGALGDIAIYYIDEPVEKQPRRAKSAYNEKGVVKVK